MVTQVGQDIGLDRHKLILTALSWPLAGGGWEPRHRERGKRGAEGLWGDPGGLPALLVGVWQGRDGCRSPVKPWTCELSQEG